MTSVSPLRRVHVPLRGAFSLLDRGRGRNSDQEQQTGDAVGPLKRQPCALVPSLLASGLSPRAAWTSDGWVAGEGAAEAQEVARRPRTTRAPPTPVSQRARRCSTRDARDGMPRPRSSGVVLSHSARTATFSNPGRVSPSSQRRTPCNVIGLPQYRVLNSRSSTAGRAT